MENRKYCVLYDFKGSSTDWHTEENTRFFPDDYGMCEFLQTITDNPNVYTFKKVYKVTYDYLTMSFVRGLITTHEETKAHNDELLRLKRHELQEKLIKNFSKEEIRMLRDEKNI